MAIVKNPQDCYDFAGDLERDDRATLKSQNSQAGIILAVSYVTARISAFRKQFVGGGSSDDPSQTARNRKVLNLPEDPAVS